jgi:glucose-fructose oxidoreductase
VLVEKPFAASVADADRMIAAMAAGGGRLAINWPLAWVASHRTACRLLREGHIGVLREVHYYGGNRGPLYHLADKVEVSDEEVQRQKPTSWWYARATGGGSLLDYLGYGATLGTWYHDGRAPLDVSTVTWAGEGIEVDEHSITVCRYEAGLSRYETRWGTFTDPWVTQTQPACGFVLVGSAGTIASADYAAVVHVQTRARREVHEVPADRLAFPHDNPVAHFLWAIEHGRETIGPLQPSTCRTGQRIIDAAGRSAAERRAVALE